MTNLNEQQQKAVESNEKNIVVAASAGTGKTTVLVERVLRKILNENIDLNRMLILTFTEAAAENMKNRLEKALREEKKKTMLTRPASMNSLSSFKLPTFQRLMLSSTSLFKSTAITWALTLNTKSLIQTSPNKSCATRRMIRSSIISAMKPIKIVSFCSN